MLKTAVGVVGVGGVGVVELAHGVVGALHNCAKYRRKREEGLFPYSKSKKTSAKFKNSDVIIVTSLVLKSTVGSRYIHIRYFVSVFQLLKFDRLKKVVRSELLVLLKSHFQFSRKKIFGAQHLRLE